jgi:hypothetical protein
LIDGDTWRNHDTCAVGRGNDSQTADYAGSRNQPVQKPTLGVQVTLLEIEVGDIQKFAVEIPVAFWCRQTGWRVWIST